MSELIGNLQYKIKSSSSGMLLFVFKIISGTILGLTMAIVFQEMIGYGTFSFTLVTVVTVMAFLRAAKGWRYVGVAVFDLICVLVALLLRMYVLVAPGA